MSLRADEGSLALFFSILFRPFFFKPSFPMRKALQRGKYVRDVFLVIIFRTVWRTKTVKEKGRGKNSHAKSAAGICGSIWRVKGPLCGELGAEPLREVTEAQ